MHKYSRKHTLDLSGCMQCICIHMTVCLYKHADCTLMHTHKCASCCIHTLVSHHRAPVKVAGRINNVSWCKQALRCTRWRPLCAVGLLGVWVLGAVKFQNEVWKVWNWSPTWRHVSGFQHYIQVSLEEKWNTELKPVCNAQQSGFLFLLFL